MERALTLFLGNGYSWLCSAGVTMVLIRKRKICLNSPPFRLALDMLWPAERAGRSAFEQSVQSDQSVQVQQPFSLLLHVNSSHPVSVLRPVCGVCIHVSICSLVFKYPLYDTHQNKHTSTLKCAFENSGHRRYATLCTH